MGLQRRGAPYFLFFIKSGANFPKAPYFLFFIKSGANFPKASKLNK
jgi:hypothetical protein